MSKEYSFETGVYRPPSEGGSFSLLIRITRNCPWNRCTFCSMYKKEKFKLRSVEEIKGDIDTITEICDRIRLISQEHGDHGQVTKAAILRLIQEEPLLGNHPGFIMVVNWLASGGETAFLQDANSLVMKTTHLVEVLTYLRKKFPTLTRVTSYARSKSIGKKELQELAQIHEAGLDRLHVGLETGDDELLTKIKKGATSDEHITAGQKAMNAGFQLSEYWMPGLGGKKMWKQHARNTARVLNEINPHYARSRPFFPIIGTPIQEELTSGDYELLSPEGQLIEIKHLVDALNFTGKLCFDHAGNHWTDETGQHIFSMDYEGYSFPKEKKEVLRLINKGLKNLPS